MQNPKELRSSKNILTNQNLKIKKSRRHALNNKITKTFSTTMHSINKIKNIENRSLEKTYISISKSASKNLLQAVRKPIPTQNTNHALLVQLNSFQLASHAEAKVRFTIELIVRRSDVSIALARALKITVFNV